MGQTSTAFCVFLVSTTAGYIGLVLGHRKMSRLVYKYRSRRKEQMASLLQTQVITEYIIAPVLHARRAYL
eukprot:4137278-Pleurochrysis_carterae.AAC.1